MEFFSFWFFLAVGAAGLFTMISVAAWSANRAAEREALYKTELMSKLAAQPPESAERVMQFLRDEEARKQRRKRAEGRFGLRLGGAITVVVGIVLTVFLRMIVVGEPVWMVGLFPLLIGVVLLAFSMVETHEPL